MTATLKIRDRCGWLTAIFDVLTLLFWTSSLIRPEWLFTIPGLPSLAMLNDIPKFHPRTVPFRNPVFTTILLALRADQIR